MIWLRILFKQFTIYSNMKNEQQIRWIIALYSLLLLIFSLVTSKSIDQNLFRWITVATSLVVVIYSVYEKWMWRWPFFNKISEAVGSPDINGTWKGTLEFEKDLSGNPGKIEFYLSIKQSLTAVLIQSFVSTSKSYSVTAKIIKGPMDKYQLIYFYRSEAPYGKRDDNRPHDGACVLDIVGSPAGELVGGYFTDRNGSGIINMTQHSKRTSETFKEASDLHY